MSGRALFLLREPTRPARLSLRLFSVGNFRGYPDIALLGVLPLSHQLAIRCVVKFAAKHLLLFAQPVNLACLERAPVAKADIEDYFLSTAE